MKKLILICLAVGLPVFAMSACDDNGSTSDNNINQPCNSAAECDTGYCGADHYCAVKPADRAANGEACAKETDCKSGYCGASGKCEAKPVNHDGVEGSACESTAECASGLICDQSKCTNVNSLDGQECAGGTAPLCIAGKVVECRQWAGMGYYYDVTTCKTGEVCSDYNADVVTCVPGCDASKLGDRYTKCDYDNTDDEGWSIGEIIFECVKFKDSYYYVAKDWHTCDYSQSCLNDKCE